MPSTPRTRRSGEAADELLVHSTRSGARYSDVSSDEATVRTGKARQRQSNHAKKANGELKHAPSEPSNSIPVHKQYSSFINRHEVPRKLFHFSIGIYTSWLYATGVQTHNFALYLLTALIPIVTADLLRLRFQWFNVQYMRWLGFMMRESEVKGFNGVIWFIIGSSLTCYILPKDISVVAVICLAWCDTAASTIGRAYGKYTPKIRGNKSLAGTAAATVVGSFVALYFWGWLAQTYGPFPDDLPNTPMFKGHLNLPFIGLLQGKEALIAMSLWTGFIAATSEAIDLYGADDNFSIPILCGLGLWSFLKLFG